MKIVLANNEDHVVSAVTSKFSQMNKIFKNIKPILTASKNDKKDNNKSKSVCTET